MKKTLAALLSLVMLLTVGATAFAAYTDAELEAFGLEGYTPNEVANNQVSMDIALDSYVLLENNGILPLTETGKVALFGNGATGTVKGGTGSGIVNQRERDWIDEALEDAGFELTTPEAYRKAVGRGVVATGFSGSRMAEDVELTDAWLEEAKAADTAIYVIGRNAGEGSDRQITSGDGAYNLTDTERANLEKVAAGFENVIVILNTQITDVSWYNEIENIDAVLHIGYGGQKTGLTTVQMLTGQVSPSGKTASTWAYDIADYSSSQAGFSYMDENTTTEYYTDGIYVGYRYFDTFGIDVAYPFGYGLSYTDFDIQVKSVSVTGEKVTVDVSVANTGDTYSGKEVVQVYFSAPDGALEKPYQELAAFGKTDTLAPGERQVLSISFDTADMSSYDESQAAYVMEAGEYILRVGNCSRNTHVAAVLTLAETAITEQLSNQLALEDGAELDEISKEGATPITYEGEADEIAAAPRYAITDLPFVNNASPFDDETITTYIFADEAADYTPRDSITLNTKTVAGIIQNAQNPDGPQFNGYQTSEYSEVVEIVPDLPAGITKDTAKLTDVIEGRITLKQLVACMTDYELARLAQGAGKTNGVGQIFDDEGNLVASSSALPGNVGRTTEELFATRHIPVLGYCDGPAGIRCDQDNVVSPEINDENRVGGTYFYSNDGGITVCAPDAEGAVRYNVLPTAFPSSSNLAGTWNTDMMYSFGYGLGAEQEEYHVGAWLAPGMNIVRNPMCGRNFEYYSEDPLLTGITAANVVSGVQAHKGGGVTIKHFWANNQEDNRNAENNVIGERAAREIYLRGYEIAIKLGQPMFMMTSYNENHGWPAGDCYDVCTDIARGEWGFKGLIMTDWGGGQSSPHISMHAGNDMITPGSAVTNITNYIGLNPPDFTEDGYVNITEIENHWGPWTWITRVEDWGNFTVRAGGPEFYKTSTNAATEEDLPDIIKEAIADRRARYDKIGNTATITWYGIHNSICRGDIQKSALNILGVFLYTQDMQILCNELGVDYSDYEQNYSVAMEAEMTDPDFVPMAVKGKVENVSIVAERVTVDTAEAQTAEVKVEYMGENDLTTVRLSLNSALPIREIVSDNDFEFNAADGRIIVYSADGTPIDKQLFTIVYEFDGLVEDGEYPVDIEVEEVTDAEGNVTDATAKDGAVIVDNTYAKGDVNQDGTVDNRDLIMIARYLVGLVEFSEKQIEAADFNNDGIVNNSDLVLIARAIVGG